jgi:hypothetical protein
MILKDFQGGRRILKLHGGDDPVGMLGWILADVQPVADAGKMTATVTISKAVPDRSGDIVDTPGIDLTDHRRNPVVLFCHKRDLLIGMAEDRDTGAYTVRQAGPDTLVGKTFFNQGSKLAHQVFDGTYRKMLRGISIGFYPVLGAVEKSHHGGTRYKQSKLVEYSHLILPDHQECLVEMVEKGLNGEPLCDPLMNYFRPMMPAKNATVVGGWETKAMPGFTDDDPTAAPADEFAPPDPNADPTAVDPTMQQPDPHADHKAVADDAAGNTAASIFEKFTSGQLDRKAAMKLFDKILRHHEDIADLGGGDDGDVDAEDDEDDEEGFDDADSFDDEGEDDEDDDGPPDLADKSKKRAEKAVAHIWHGTYEPVMSDVFAAIGHVVREKDLDPEKAQAYLRKQMRRMQKLPSVLGMVKKALADADSAWDEWNEAFFRRNGTH